MKKLIKNIKKKTREIEKEIYDEESLKIFEYQQRESLKSVVVYPILIQIIIALLYAFNALHSETTLAAATMLLWLYFPFMLFWMVLFQGLLKKNVLSSFADDSLIFHLTHLLTVGVWGPICGIMWAGITTGILTNSMVAGFGGAFFAAVYMAGAILLGKEDKVPPFNV